MSEALIFLLNVLVVTYLCWCVYRADKARRSGKSASLGYLGYKDDAKRPVNRTKILDVHNAPTGLQES